MEKSFRCDQLSVEIYKNKHDLGKAAAEIAGKQIKRAINQKGEAVVLFASAGSQIEFIKSLITHDVGWNHVCVFHLDEYIGISAQHPASFRRFLYDRVLNKVSIGKFYPIEGENPDSDHECQRIDKIFSQKNVDIACIGIGENGHIAFNEPPAYFNDEVNFKIIELDNISRMQQVKEGWFNRLEEVPEKAITMTIPAILSSKSIVCSVSDERKAKAVKNTLEGSVSPDVPASILRNHPQATLLLDISSASALTKFPKG